MAVNRIDEASGHRDVDEIGRSDLVRLVDVQALEQVGTNLMFPIGTTEYFFVYSGSRHSPGSLAMTTVWHRGQYRSRQCTGAMSQLTRNC